MNTLFIPPPKKISISEFGEVRKKEKERKKEYVDGKGIKMHRGLMIRDHLVILS